MSFASRRPAGEGFIVNPIPVPASWGDTAVDPADASADIIFGTDGTGSYKGIAIVNFNWYSVAPATGIGASYWARLTVNSGSSPTGGSATGSWLQMNASRSWTLSRTTIGTLTGNWTVQIASDAAGANIVASRTFDITATVTA